MAYRDGKVVQDVHQFTGREAMNYQLDKGFDDNEDLLNKSDLSLVELSDKNDEEQLKLVCQKCIRDFESQYEPNESQFFSDTSSLNLQDLVDYSSEPETVRARKNTPLIKCIKNRSRKINKPKIAIKKSGFR